MGIRTIQGTMETIEGGWHTVEVARAQRDLVLDELSRANKVKPYQAFVWAMDVIGLKEGRLLDVGCGCGHYGVLCERLYPNIEYFGTDASWAMIREARQLAPLARFATIDFEHNDFKSDDIVLLSQVVEMMDDPVASMSLALRSFKRYAILNRIRLTRAESYRIESEPTYCGNVGHNWVWSLGDLLDLMPEACNVAMIEWDNQATLVVGHEDGPECPNCHKKHFDWLGHQDSSFLAEGERLCTHCHSVIRL